MRMLAPGMQQRLGRSVVIENRADLNGIIATRMTAEARPDGNVMLASENSFYTNPGLLKTKLPYDPIQDFTGVTMLASAPIVMIASAGAPFSSLNELIARAQARGVNYASGGVGSGTHLAGVILAKASSSEMRHIPYKGSGAAMNALLGGEIDFQFGGLSSSRELIQAGRIKALAITGERRHPSVPSIPTFAELGFSSVDLLSLWSIHAPKDTDLEIRRMIRRSALEAMNEPATNTKLATLGYDVVGSTPEDHQLRSEQLINRWRELGKSITID